MSGLVLGSLLAAVACGSPPPSSPPAVGRITYQVSGGFTGWDRTLIVEPDGTARVTVVRGPSPAAAGTRVDPGVLRHLHALVSSSDFAQLDAAYLPPPGGADLQDYAITVELGGRTLKTMTRDAAVRPEVLGEVMAILSGVMSVAMTAAAGA